MVPSQDRAVPVRERLDALPRRPARRRSPGFAWRQSDSGAWKVVSSVPDVASAFPNASASRPRAHELPRHARPPPGPACAPLRVSRTEAAASRWDALSVFARLEHLDNASLTRLASRPCRSGN
ncbi:hypothetical protein PsYK624_094470 [Phanerochaete sordida]|uniref:Uncharacterized protein n=1 Tax=Phanerochaete sordida TaxID=48140 RepID=A0A9P3GBZ1_9APHY|nr:hypothetical protein PsYK624_094470 [Phanerochaete sordida]